MYSRTSTRLSKKISQKLNLIGRSPNSVWFNLYVPVYLLPSWSYQRDDLWLPLLLSFSHTCCMLYCLLYVAVKNAFCLLRLTVYTHCLPSTPRRYIQLIVCTDTVYRRLTPMQSSVPARTVLSVLLRFKCPIKITITIITITLSSIIKGGQKKY